MTALKCFKCGLMQSDSAVGSILPQCKCWVLPAPIPSNPAVCDWRGLSEEEIALLEWAVSTLSDFSASDRSRPAWQFVYMPKLADLRNMVEQHRAKLREKNA